MYAGAPEYTGAEYDYEVPDNLLIASPGGISTTHHHYTKGFYGDGASSWDIYGGEGYAYPYAEHGNLYQVGQSAPYYMGQYAQPPDVMYTQNQSQLSPQRDNFTDVELIPPPDTPTPSTASGTTASGGPVTVQEKRDVLEATKRIDRKLVFSNPFATFMLFLLAYIALDLWANAGESFIVEKLNGGRPLTWKKFGVYAIVFTVALVVVATVLKTPLIAFEQV